MSASRSSARSRRRRSSMPSAPLPDRRNLFLAFLVVLFILYWVFAWRMERIDWSPDNQPLLLAQFMRIVPIALPGIVYNIAEFFAPDVLRHFIPLVLGWYLAYVSAVNLLWALYDLPDRDAAAEFLRRLRAPGRVAEAPLTLTPRTLEEQRQDAVRLRVGGPGRIQLPVGYLAVTELNSRFYRILEAGTRSLGRFEYVHTVLDLRPQERNQEQVPMVTSDGLQVCADVGATFRVSLGDEPVTEQRPFPFDRAAVRRLAYDNTNLGDRISSWEAGALGTVIGIVKKTVATFTLDQLLQEPDTDVGSHLSIRRDVERQARRALRERGIDLLRVRLGAFSFPEPVTKQHVAYWRAFWNSQAEIVLADGRATALEEREIAQAEADLAMIQAIVEGVRQAQQQSDPQAMTDLLALRMLEALEKLVRRAEGTTGLVDSLMPQLEDLRLQLAAGETAALGSGEENEPEA